MYGLNQFHAYPRRWVTTKMTLLACPGNLALLALRCIFICVRNPLSLDQVPLNGSALGNLGPEMLLISADALT
jgi:hypothetical protein